MNTSEEPKKELSLKEQRIRKITQLYYSRQDIQKTIFDFSKNREVIPRYFEGFGKRPDGPQYPSDIMEMVRRGATSFHCSEEIWEDPMQISTELTPEQFNELRTGWDLLIDIDSKYIDYSKISGELIIETLKFHGIKNIGVKFSGSKGFHIIVPWKAFPKEINGVKTSDMFPEWPRIISRYITKLIEKKLIEKITKFSTESKYVKDFQAPKEVMPDIILVSPRHLFRMPYSLHEKTALASIVIDKEKISEFQITDADPLKAKVSSFYPEPKENEAKELMIQALDWWKENQGDIEKNTGKVYGGKTFKIVKIKLGDLSDKFFSPSIQKILEGLKGDGKKRALFILLNLFRSTGMDKEELEKRIYEWNQKNNPSLKEGYIKAQLAWSYRNKPVPPPNYDKDHYKAIGIIPTEEELRYKNPLSYTVKKFFAEKTNGKKKKANKQ